MSNTIGLAAALQAVGIAVPEMLLHRPTKMTGQLIARVHGQTPDGRDLVSLTGIVAVPKGTFQSEHQYTFIGDTRPNDLVGAVIDTKYGTDLSARTIGMTPSQFLTMPIWRY